MTEIYGMKLRDDLKPNDVPIDAVVIVKYLTENGDTAWMFTTTESLQDMECVGLLHMATKIQEDYIKEGFAEGDDE